MHKLWEESISGPPKRGNRQLSNDRNYLLLIAFQVCPECPDNKQMRYSGFLWQQKGRKFAQIIKNAILLGYNVSIFTRSFSRKKISRRKYRFAGFAGVTIQVASWQSTWHVPAFLVYCYDLYLYKIDTKYRSRQV